MLRAAQEVHQGPGLVVRELDNGAPVAELCRKLGVSGVTLCNWKRLKKKKK